MAYRDELLQLFEKIETFKIGEILQLGKLILYIGIFIGLWNLVTYTTTYNIPFPFSIVDLAPALLVIMLITTGIVCIFIFAVFFPAFITGEIFGLPHKCIYIKGKPNKTEKIWRYMRVTGFPILVLSSALFTVALLDHLASTIVIFFFWAILFVATLYFSMTEIRKNIKPTKVKKYIATNLTIIAIQFYWFLAITAIALNFIPDDAASMFFYIGIIPYLFLMLFIFSILKSALKKVPFKPAVILFLSIYLLLSLTFSSWFTRGALKILSSGGEVEAYIIFDQPGAKYLPNKMIMENDKHQSKIIYVMLDLGSKIYIKESKESDITYSIDRKGINSVVHFSNKKRLE